MNDIFLESFFKITHRCDAKSLLTNIDESLLSALKQTYESKCSKDGYVMEDSISIVKRSLPYLYGSQINSSIKYNIIYKAKVCCPMTDNIIKCKIDIINKLGLQCITPPLRILIPKEFHKNTTIFNTFKIGDEIEIKVIDKKFNINDKIIQVVAKLNNDTQEDIYESMSDNESLDDVDGSVHNQSIEYTENKKENIIKSDDDESSNSDDSSSGESEDDKLDDSYIDDSEPDDNPGDGKQVDNNQVEDEDISDIDDDDIMDDPSDIEKDETDED